MAARVHAFLAGRRLKDTEVQKALGVGNAFKYATTTGTLLIRWEGARAPAIWTVPRPEIDPLDARSELARRYLHVFGPGTPEAFSIWAGIGAAEARAAFDALSTSLTAVRTPIGDAWILARDEPELPRAAGTRRRRPPPAERRHLLPATGEPTASSSSPTPRNAPSSGPPASGRAPSSSPARSSGRGGEPRPT